MSLISFHTFYCAGSDSVPDAQFFSLSLQYTITISGALSDVDISMGICHAEMVQLILATRIVCWPINT